MDPVFSLFTRLGMFKDGLMIEYKMSADNTFQMYNGIRHNDADPQSTDIFRVSESSGGAVPDKFVAQGVDNIAAEIFGPYAEAFNWDELELPADEEREWYCVAFRSKRKEGSDSGRESLSVYYLSLEHAYAYAPLAL